MGMPEITHSMRFSSTWMLLCPLSSLWTDINITSMKTQSTQFSKGNSPGEWCECEIPIYPGIYNKSPEKVWTIYNESVTMIVAKHIFISRSCFRVRRKDQCFGDIKIGETCCQSQKTNFSNDIVTMGRIYEVKHLLAGIVSRVIRRRTLNHPKGAQ